MLDKFMNSKWGILALILLIFGGPTIWDKYKNHTSLDFSSTVYDYQQASVESRFNFSMNKCLDGKCLEKKYWDCGFELDTVGSLTIKNDMLTTENSFRDCVNQGIRRAQRVNPALQLGAIIHACGRRHKTPGRFAVSRKNNPECQNIQ